MDRRGFDAAEAALLLGQCERSFRRHAERYRADGLEGLLDQRLSQISKRRGKHRLKRERAPPPGMMVRQDASTHGWVSQVLWDLAVTMDDATGEYTSMFFCDTGARIAPAHGRQVGRCAAVPGPCGRPTPERGSCAGMVAAVTGRGSRWR